MQILPIPRQVLVVMGLTALIQGGGFGCDGDGAGGKNKTGDVNQYVVVDMR